MGMSASQVRFLSLQSRKNTIGNELATLANRKSSLARDMKVISANYDNEINQTQLKWSYNSGETYNTLSYDLLMRPCDLNSKVPYILTDSSGKVVLNNDVIRDLNGNPVMIQETQISGGAANTTDNPLTYITLAKMITGDSVSNGGGDHPYEYDDNFNTTGGDANPDAYTIPKDIKEFATVNSLRTDIFKKMGLISQDQIDQMNQILTQLYGDESAYETGIYPANSAMGKYNIAIANKEAYYQMISTDYNIKISDDSYTTTTMFNTNNYTYINNVASGSTEITQQYDSNVTGAATNVTFSSVPSGYTETGSVSLGNGITYEYTVSNSGVSVKYTMDPIWDAAESNKGTVIDTKAVQISKNGETETINCDSLVIGENTFEDVSSYTCYNCNTSEDIMENEIASMVFKQVDSIIRDLKQYSYLNLNSSILSQIRAEIANSVESLDNYSNTTVGSVSQTHLLNAAASAQGEGSANTPKIYAVTTNSANHRYAFGCFNKANLKQYIINKYSEYSLANNASTWNARIKANDTLLNYLNNNVETAQKAVDSLKGQLNTVFTAAQLKQMDYYDALFLRIAQNGWTNDSATSVELNGNKANEYLEKKLSNNILFITECKPDAYNKDVTYTMKMAQNIDRVFNVHKTDEEGIALQKYEEAKTEIQMKENKIDVIMNKLETEQNAITTEMTSLEKLVDDNVKTVFKMFG